MGLKVAKPGNLTSMYKPPQQNWGTMANSCEAVPWTSYGISVLLWQAGGPCTVFSPGFEQDAWNARIWKQLAGVRKKKMEVKDVRGTEWLACVGTANHGSRLDFQCECQCLITILQPLIWNKWSWCSWARWRENKRTGFDSSHSSQHWHKILLHPVQHSSSFKTIYKVVVLHSVHQ